MGGFKLAVDEESKASELRVWNLRGSVRQNPHMRAFWAATISCFFAQLGWFALAPLGLDVASSIGICENQLYPPADFPTRPAYLMFENLNTQRRYCRFGRNDLERPSDCNPGPDGADGERYDASALSECICTSGTSCAAALDDAAMASVASTIFARVFLGTLLERWGPVNVQASLLAFGAMWVAASAGITAVWNLILVRFFVGAVGAAFVTNSFWCSLMFSQKILGTAAGTAGGWGGLSGGITDIFMLIALAQPLKASGLPSDSAWRLAVLVPAALMLACAIGVKCLCWDTPTRKRFSAADLGKQGGSSASDYATALKDIKVILLIIQYSAALGPGLVMFNKLSTHFMTYFQMAPGDAAKLASAFGGMSLFARSLGGALSDAMSVRFGLRGRLWVTCSLLLLEALFFFAFGLVDNTQSWTVALGVLVVFALFMQMACAATTALVPFTQKQNLAITSALVSAGGNVGAVVAGFAFYRSISDPLLPFKLHAAYVFVCALLTPIYYWPEHGGMFARPRVADDEAACAHDIEAKPVDAAISAKESEPELTTDAEPQSSSEAEPSSDADDSASELGHGDDVVAPLMSEVEPRMSARCSEGYMGPLTSEAEPKMSARVSEDYVGPLMSDTVIHMKAVRAACDAKGAPVAKSSSCPVLASPVSSPQAGKPISAPQLGDSVLASEFAEAGEEDDVVPLMSEIGSSTGVGAMMSEVSRRHTGRE